MYALRANVTKNNNHNVKINFIEKIIKKDLKKKKNRIISTRFPPEPNGYLHIGHVKSIYLNYSLAKKYNGIFKLRFDDTNPNKEDIKYIQTIKNDLKWLGFNLDKSAKFTSDYFHHLYHYAIELIKKGLAYVDKLSKDQIRLYRGNLITPGINSPYRNTTIEKNLLLFNDMKIGKFSEGSACLRAKINMKSSSIVMRDPVLYRISLTEHHQTGKYWRIYPTYDFSHCVSDAIENITHSLCTLEFQDNKKLYDWILNNISIKNKPKQYEFSKLCLEYSVLSKRKIKTLIEKNIVNNWDDPRLCTLSGLRRRGYTPNAINYFCERIGITKKEGFVQLSFLESCVRNELNIKASRVMAILDPIKIVISNLEKNHKEILFIPNHPTNKKMGYRKYPFTKEIYIDRSDFSEYSIKNSRKLSIETHVRLRYSYVITVTKIYKDVFNNIKLIECTYDKKTLKTNPKTYKVSGVIHWISKDNALNSTFNLYGPLFTIKNPEKEKNYLSFINNKSWIKKQGLVEKSIKLKKNNNFYQFERIGYFCFDKANFGRKKILSKELSFNQIVSLKEKKIKKI